MTNGGWTTKADRVRLGATNGNTVDLWLDDIGLDNAAMPLPTPAQGVRVLRYSYDGLQRLTGATESSGSTFGYAYDNAGNRTSVQLNGGAPAITTYNNANQITNAGFSYDTAGNLTNDGTAYTYDALNRTTVRGATTYAYNGDGTLVSQATSGVTTRYTQDLAAPLSQVLQIKVGAAAPTDYLYGLNRLASLNSGVKTWYVADALGSVRRTVTNAGVPLGIINYDPWGTPESGTVPTFGFTGEVQDVASGLVNLRARWYSTGRGRFTSVDSWMGDEAHSQSLNTYGYVGSNPVGLTDPSGHCYPPIESLRQLEPLNCSNLDQAARIINHPNASDGDKAKAGAYLGAWAFGHAGVLVGLAFAGGGIAAEIGTAVASSSIGTAAGNVGLSVAVWAANYLQMNPDVAAGVQAAGVNILLQQATLQGDQTAQSILANPIGIIGCNLWGQLGEAAATALRTALNPIDSFIGRNLKGLSAEEWSELTKGWTMEHSHYQPPKGRFAWQEVPQWKFTSPDGSTQVRIHGPQLGYDEYYVARVGTKVPPGTPGAVPNPFGDDSWLYLDGNGNLTSNMTDMHIQVDAWWPDMLRVFGN